MREELERLIAIIDGMIQSFGQDTEKCKRMGQEKTILEALYKLCQNSWSRLYTVPINKLEKTLAFLFSREANDMIITIQTWIYMQEGLKRLGPVAMKPYIDLANTHYQKLLKKIEQKEEEIRKNSVYSDNVDMVEARSFALQQLKQKLLENTYFTDLDTLHTVLQNAHIDAETESSILAFLLKRNEAIYQSTRKVEMPTCEPYTPPLSTQDDPYVTLEPTIPTSSYVSSLSEEAKYYIALLNEEKNMKDILYCLPPKTDENWDKLTDEMITFYQHEIEEINKTLSTIQDDNLFVSFSDIKTHFEFLLSLLKAYMLGQEESLAKSKTEGGIYQNRILFLKTPSGKPYFLNDLKSIPEEYYKDLIDLLGQITNDTIVNPKPFTNYVKPVSELRTFKVRLLYDKIDENTYIVLAVYLKKGDSLDSGLKETIMNRLQYYVNIVPIVKKELQDDESRELLLEDEEKIYEEFISMLIQEKRVRR